MLTKSQRDRWAAALRSGEYQQCRGTLYDIPNDVRVTPNHATSYCCLGVLSKVIRPELWENPSNDQSLYPAEVGILLEDSDPIVDFVSLNDIKMLSFSQIAEYVDKLPTSD